MNIAERRAVSIDRDAPVVDAAIDILAHLVSFETVSSRSNNDAIAYIADYFKAIGACVTVIPAKGQDKRNLWVTLGEGSRDGLVLSGHVDVVPTDGQQWTRPPFALTREGDRLYGRGSTDMKGFLACAMAVAARLDISALSRPVHVAVTFDEEVGCIGAHELVAFMAEHDIRPAAIFVGEPTSFTVVDRHKGSVGFTTDIVGQAAHSSQVHLGVSAIGIAADLIGFLGALAEEQKKLPVDEAFPYPYPSINVGTVHGGYVRNIVAPECELQWEMRPILPGQLTAMRSAFDAHMEQILARYAKEGSAIPAITTRCVWDSPPLVSDPKSVATAMALQATGHNHTRGVSYGTEAGIYQQAGHPTVVCGPGDIQQAHTADEWIGIGQIEACVTFLTRLIASNVRPDPRA
jgi:acetylornithine deacetylase